MMFAVMHVIDRMYAVRVGQNVIKNNLKESEAEELARKLNKVLEEAGPCIDVMGYCAVHKDCSGAL